MPSTPPPAGRTQPSFDPLPEVPILEILGSDTHLHRVSRTELAGPCPWCGGTDRFHANRKTTRWWCRQCSDSAHWGSAADYLMRRHHLTFPQAADRLRDLAGLLPARPAPSSPLAGMEDFCAARRLNAATLAFTFSVRPARIDGRPALRYPSGIGVERVKFLDGQKPKYRWVGAGGALHWYNLARAGTPDHVLPIYIVNGEPSVWAADESGVVATCLCGGERALPSPALVATLQAAAGKRPIRIVYDRDETGRTGARTLVTMLRAAGLHATALVLPADLGEGADVDDLHRRAGTEDLAAALACLPPLPTPGSVDDDWPVPLPLTTGQRPPFPLDIFPGWLQDYTGSVAEAFQTPVDLPALLALDEIAVGAARHCRLEIRADWSETLCLWMVIVLPSGERKSPVFTELMQPLRSYERTYNDAHRLEIARAQARARQLDQQIAKAERAPYDDPEGARAVLDRLVAERLDLTVPEELELYVGDVTPERLATVLAEQHGAVGMLSDEGGLLTTVTGRRYGDGGVQIDELLKAYSGTEFKIGRAGRRVHVLHPAFTVGLTVQPAILHDLLTQPEFNGRGFVARFLFSLPESRVGHRLSNPPPVDRQARLRWHRHMHELLALEPPIATPGLDDDAWLLQLSDAAREPVYAFMDWLEPQMAPGGALASEAQWANKLTGTATRIGALLTFAHRGVDGTIEQPIGRDAMEQSLRLARSYLIPHAQAALGMAGMDPRIAQAQQIVAWAGRKRRHAFARRDLRSDLRHTMQDPRDLDRALDLLCDFQYLRRQGTPSGRPGPKAEVYFVNPHLLHDTAQHTADEAPSSPIRLHSHPHPGTSDQGPSHAPCPCDPNSCNSRIPSEQTAPPGWSDDRQGHPAQGYDPNPGISRIRSAQAAPYDTGDDLADPDQAGDAA